uniref:Outer dense fiber protein 3-like protein 2 n=1 Tax=Cacopsylla melanoneura TaxID=428564 RepID=A0A8D8YWA9_9HEMI
MDSPTEHEHNIVAEFRGKTPGPNKYMLPTLLGRKHHDPTKRQAPAFTMQGRRHPEKVSDTQPGPNKYQTSNTTRYGAVGVGNIIPVFKGRVGPFGVAMSKPGPKYDVTDGVKQTRLSKPPSFTMSGWSKVVPPNLNFPGPQYALPTYINGTGKLRVDKGSPAFTMKSRVPHTDFDRQIPGPQAYAAPSLTLTKQNVPKLKILENPSHPKARDNTPGANKYDAMVNPIGKSGPSFSMASRHNTKAGTMRTGEDLLGYGISGLCDLG